ncbi:hypothetical protein B0H14DRAFT_3084268 [Mycena olivaceomarginata]|nr:hypothetical protein B0H14DRAFT_3084268 [Mycena olivaceomarginata]
MVDEFEHLDYGLAADDWALSSCQYMSHILPAVQYHSCLAKPNNFAGWTQIQCLKINEARPGELPPCSFFVPLAPTANTSFGNSIEMTREGVEQRYFSKFNADPAFVMNLLGRPDYWAPMTRHRFDEQDALESLDHWCQHPRWNLHYQGAPVSVYMRFDRQQNTILYIISYKEDDTVIRALKSILDLTSTAASKCKKKRLRMYLDEPLHLHAMVSMLSFEAMKHHVVRFRRFMWHNINAVEDHQTGSVNTNRQELRKRTTALQTTTSSADSLIASAEVAIITVRSIRNTHFKLHEALGSSKGVTYALGETLEYLLDSFEQQKMWLVNYQSRNQSSMGLVYNLVTQDDAANNISLATDMRGDSASMTAIALLTMLFCRQHSPRYTILGAGIFNPAAANSSTIEVTNFWWFWLVLTVPLTVLTVVSWGVYHRKSVGELLKAKEIFNESANEDA